MKGFVRENGLSLFFATIFRRISLEHLRGEPWARIGERVGQRNLAVTANTYTHVLSDETELEYEVLIRARTTHTPVHTHETEIAH